MGVSGYMLMMSMMMFMRMCMYMYLYAHKRIVVARMNKLSFFLQNVVKLVVNGVYYKLYYKVLLNKLFKTGSFENLFYFCKDLRGRMADGYK